VDQDGLTAREPLAQLIAPDPLDVLAEVVTRSSLHLGKPGDGGFAQRQPHPQSLPAGDLVADARSLALARDHAGGVQGLQMLGDEYISLADQQGMPIVAVLDTHLQADHVSGLPELVRRTGAAAYLPEGAGVEFEHHALADGEVVELGNTEIQAIATPGHAGAHHAYLVTDRTRGDDPWLVLSGDALLVGDAGRPDLHAHAERTVEEMARLLYR